MAKKTKGPQVLTGNLLGDGMVVFLGPDGSWRNDIDTAQIARSQEDAATLETEGADAVRASLLVDPYLVEVEETENGLVPVEFRERRRISGPSVNLEFNSRANGQPAFAA